MRFLNLFSHSKPVIGCIHLAPLPGAPRYRKGGMDVVYERALKETEIYAEQQVDGLIVENFNDAPFYPDHLPSETVAALAAVTRDIVRRVDMPVGVNALRNDGPAAVAIAAASGAAFVRVNVHLGAVVADQGLIQGNAHATLRQRRALEADDICILADVRVKHANPIVQQSLSDEAQELTLRGQADALVVSGAFTGAPAAVEDMQTIQAASNLPLVLGSGAQPERLAEILPHLDALIVGSYFKVEGKATHPVDAERVKRFMDARNRWLASENA